MEQRDDRLSDEPGGMQLLWVRVRSAVHSVALVCVLGWCLVAAFQAFQLSHPLDLIADLDEEFSLLAEHLPPYGQVGFLDRYENGGTDDAVRTWYTAQYALAPRVVVSRVGPEYLIVARGAARPAGDPRLEGYTHIETVAGGHRLYRRSSR
jgi:hypothetical protein